MSWLAISPIILPLITAILVLLFRNPRRQQIISLAGAGFFFVHTILLLLKIYQSGIEVVHIGNWPAPYGIVLVIDLFSAIMIAVTGFVGLNIALYAIADVDRERSRFGFYPLMYILLMGVCGAFMTGDLFNLYVCFEIMLMSSFVLMALGGERAQIEGAVKYVSLNFIASVMFLTAIGIIYGKTGSLNMADLALKIGGNETGPLVKSATMLLLSAFGIKAGIFPFFFWLPASYHTPPATVSALFAGLLTKVGVYAMIRVFTLVFAFEMTGTTKILLIIISGFTMVTGVLGAAAQYEIRKILAFHIISQIGYMILGLALFTPLALAAAIFYIVHHIIVKTNLFLIGGLVRHIKGSYDLKKLGGLYLSHPLLAIVFLIPALSLGGIPPLSGFFAKFTIIRAALNMESYLIVFVALAVSVLTLYSMTKIWAEAFWNTGPAAPPTGRTMSSLMLIPIILLAAATIGIGFYPDTLLQFSHRAAEQLFDRALYIRNVLGVY